MHLSVSGDKTEKAAPSGSGCWEIEYRDAILRQADRWAQWVTVPPAR